MPGVIVRKRSVEALYTVFMVSTTERAPVVVLVEIVAVTLLTPAKAVLTLSAVTAAGKVPEPAPTVTMTGASLFTVTANRRPTGMAAIMDGVMVTEQV